MFNEFFDQYLETLLWSSTDMDTEQPLDDDYGIYDFEPNCLANIKSEALDYFYTSRHLWYSTPDNYGLTLHAHDFALTRNGHGAGYWDRGLGRLGDKLTKACEAYGNIDLYVGDDGMLYASGFETN